MLDTQIFLQNIFQNAMGIILIGYYKIGILVFTVTALIVYHSTTSSLLHHIGRNFGNKFGLCNITSLFMFLYLRSLKFTELRRAIDMQ